VKLLWAKPDEAARIARSRAIAYTTRLPDGVFLRTETPRRRSGSGLLPFSSPEPDRDRWATRQLSAGPPGCIRRPSRLAGTSEPVREGGNLSHGVGMGYRRNWGGVVEEARRARAGHLDCRAQSLGAWCPPSRYAAFWWRLGIGRLGSGRCPRNHTDGPLWRQTRLYMKSRQTNPPAIAGERPAANVVNGDHRPNIGL
jgi:hypothetical protein